MEKMKNRKMTVKEINRYLLSEINIYKELEKEFSTYRNCEKISLEYKKNVELLEQIYENINM